MRLRTLSGAIPVALVAAALAGCADAPAEGAPGVEYLGIETHLLDGDLVNFQVRSKGGAGAAEAVEYARCAAAQYAVIRGYGFARHVRTVTDERSGIWKADAVYTISPALPRGTLTIDAEVVVADCTARGIPTV